MTFFSQWSMSHQEVNVPMPDTPHDSTEDLGDGTPANLKVLRQDGVFSVSGNRVSLRKGNRKRCAKGSESVDSR